jgi:hypothetical protein
MVSCQLNKKTFHLIVTSCQLRLWVFVSCQLYNPATHTLFCQSYNDKMPDLQAVFVDFLCTINTVCYLLFS